MKRDPTTLADVADWQNLAWAACRAARGKRQRQPVRRFLADLPRELSSLARDILEANVRVGAALRFRIHDPKPRWIHAPPFRERVLHHALIAHVGPVLDRALVADTFACREGKGALACVRRAQYHARRFAWYVKVDVCSYFASIDHGVLLGLLRCRFKDDGMLRLMRRIVAAHEHGPGRGLPIGALTSQHFANYYLAGLDRFLLETCRVRGMVRYMDDVVWWCDGCRDAVESLARVGQFLRERRRLSLKPSAQVNRSRHGVTVCGYRVLRGTIRLSRRRRRRYAAARARWERAFARARISGPVLQAGYASVLAGTLHADALAWRREQLARRPVDGALL